MSHLYLPTPPSSPPVVYTQQPQITHAPHALYANNYANPPNAPIPSYPIATPVYPVYSPYPQQQPFVQQPYPHSYPAQYTQYPINNIPLIKPLKRDITTFDNNNINIIPPPKRQRLNATNPYKINDRVEVKEDTIMGPIWLPGTIVDIGTDWFVVQYDNIVGMEKELHQKIYINSLRFTVRPLSTTQNKSDIETKIINKNISKSEPESESESEHEKPEKKHRLDVAIADPSKMSKIRQQTFLQKGKNDNSYYYRFNKDGESQRNGAWNSDEHKAFMKRVSEFGVNEKWGLFSVVIYGRVGYQCSNYWRQLIKNGDINDPNYYRDSNGKLKYKKKSQLNINNKNEYEKFRRFSFTVMKDPSNIFYPLPATHKNGAKINNKRKIKLKIKKRKVRKIRKIRKVRESPSDDENDSLLQTYNVRSGCGLVLIICIKDYETLTGKTLNNLNGTVKDKDLMKNLFCNEYKYKVICNDKDIVNLQDFDAFINKARYELFYNYLNYDSFILIFSGHGSKENIYLSDGNCFGRIDLYKFFNGLNCQPFKDKPKLLVIDACKGGDVAPKIENNNNNYSVAMKCANGLTTHPDDNIIIFNANSDEYVSFDSPNGGVLINSFHDVLSRNKNKICLDDMTKCIDIKMKEMGNKMNVVQTLQNIQHGIKQKIYFCKR